MHTCESLARKRHVREQNRHVSLDSINFSFYAIRTVRKLSLNPVTRRNFRYREENCISRSKYKRSPETVRRLLCLSFLLFFSVGRIEKTIHKYTILHSILSRASHDLLLPRRDASLHTSSMHISYLYMINDL